MWGRNHKKETHEKWYVHEKKKVLQNARKKRSCKPKEKGGHGPDESVTEF